MQSKNYEAKAKEFIKELYTMPKIILTLNGRLYSCFNDIRYRTNNCMSSEVLLIAQNA